MSEMLTALAAPPEEAPPPRGLLASWFPHQNMLAVSAYYFAIFGLAPIVGAILGPLALGLGLAGFWRAVQEPEARGGGHALFAVVAGVLETVLNWSGLLIYVAFWWVFVAAPSPSAP